MSLSIFESEISFQFTGHGDMFLGLFVLFLTPSFVDQQQFHIIVMLNLR